jgi:transcriptional regulator with XRE-family HTH domain
MIIDRMPVDDFADLLGDAFEAFLSTQGLNQAEAATRMGMGRATLNTYTSGVNGERRRPPAEFLTKACVLLGFEFEYEGHVIVARKKGKPVAIEEKQLHLEFTRQIDLAKNGAITVGLKKPPGKIELSFSLREIS